MNQLDFLQLVTVEKVEPKPPTPWELMAKGLKENRMGAVDREEFLLRQIERMKVRECGTD